MGFYRQVIFPRILHRVMQNPEANEHRGRVVPAATGRVLEIGIGSGLNLPYYSDQVEALVGLDPSQPMLDMAQKAAKGIALPLELVNRGAEDLPFDRASFDSVLSTWSLCSIVDLAAALSEIRRVLKPSGRLIFLEHGLSAEPRVAAWQSWLNRPWSCIAGGCNLNRPIDARIRQAGFTIASLETGYLMKGPRPLTFHFEGWAKPN